MLAMGHVSLMAKGRNFSNLHVLGMLGLTCSTVVNQGVRSISLCMRPP